MCLFIDALWSSAGKGLTFWLSFVMSNCEVVTFPLVSWVCCLIVSISDICPFSYFKYAENISNKHERIITKIISEYDQEIRQSQTADKPMAP